MKDARVVGGVSPLQAEQVLHQRYQALHDISSHVQQATALTASVADRLALRSAQLDRIFGSLTPAVFRRLHRQQRRRDEIYRHVSQHLKDVQELCDVREGEAKRATEVLRDVAQRERNLGKRVDELAERMGLEEGVSLDVIEERMREMKEEEDARDLATMF